MTAPRRWASHEVCGAWASGGSPVVILQAANGKILSLGRTRTGPEKMNRKFGCSYHLVMFCCANCSSAAPSTRWLSNRSFVQRAMVLVKIERMRCGPFKTALESVRISFPGHPRARWIIIARPYPRPRTRASRTILQVNCPVWPKTWRIVEKTAEPRHSSAAQLDRPAWASVLQRWRRAVLLAVTSWDSVSYRHSRTSEMTA